MAGIMDILGKGIMPNFGMRGSRSSPFTNVSEDMLNTAAAGEAMRQSISDKYSSDLSAFDQGTAALKDIFGTKEPSIEDLFSDSATETISSDLVADEEPSGFSFSDIFSDYTTVDEATGETTDQSTGEAILARGTTGLALSPFLKKILIGGKGNPYATTALAIPEVLRIGGNIIAPEATAALEESIGAGYNEYIDPYVSPITGAISDKISEIEAAQDIEDEIFRQGLIDQGADEASQYFDEAVRGGSMTADELDEYENMILDPLPSFDNYYADGGRVGLNTGGMPNKLAYGYTPFMDAQQGLNYYQQFAAPNYPIQQAVPVPSVPGEGGGQSSAVPPEGFGSMQDGMVKDLTLGNQLGDNIIKPNDSGENRGAGYYDFQGGYKGFGGRDDIDQDQTTIGFNDEGKLVYTGFKSTLDPTKLYGGIQVGDEVPFVSPALGALSYGTKAVNDFFSGLFGKKDKDIQDEIDRDNAFEIEKLKQQKAKEQKEYEAQQQKIAEDKRIADELAATKREEAARRTAEEAKAKEMADARAARKAASTEASRQAAVDKAKQNLKDRVSRFNSNPSNQRKGLRMTASGDTYSTKSYSKQDRDRNRQNNRSVGRQASKADRSRASRGKTGGGFCFDPNTLVQMFDGSEKRIKDIKLGDKTKGGEVTGVFQFKAADEIHDYKGVTVAGSHYVKEGGKFIMVQDSPISVKIDKIPVVHSLDTTGRRIFIKDIEFADYNGDGIAKGFLANAGVDLTGFDQEVLRQVEHRLI